jgi:hypothetical protein
MRIILSLITLATAVMLPLAATAQVMFPNKKILPPVPSSCLTPLNNQRISLEREYYSAISRDERNIANILARKHAKVLRKMSSSCPVNWPSLPTV